MDFSSIPKILDARMEAMDEDNALRPTILKPTEGAWTFNTYPSLLSKKPKVETLGAMEQKTQRNRAMDLLDSLTRSGALGIDAADLHVIIAATHTFDTTVMETVIKKNQNPVEKVEASMLLMGSTIHNLPPVDLVVPNQRSRIAAQWATIEEFASGRQISR